MTSVPSPSPSRRTPLSAPDSGNSNPHSPSFPKNQLESATNNGDSLSDEKKPDLLDDLDHLNCSQRIQRFKRYEAEYTQRLMAKYFSGKTINGVSGDDKFMFVGKAFDEQTIGNEIIKSSRFPCYQSYADPAVGFEDQCSNGSTPSADTQANIPNGKHLVKN